MPKSWPDDLELYVSSSGDRWSLVRDAATSEPVVRHEPNRPSGGIASTVPISEFLERHAHAPEGQALLRLIGTLLDTPGPTAKS